MVPNDAGRMTDDWWRKLSQKFPSWFADTFVVMPNHIHGIIIRDDIVGADPRVRPEVAHSGAPLPRIVQWFKTMTTNAYIRGVNERGWMSFANRLWQRNYHEHIIRDDEELQRIRGYIINNPVNWKDDPDNPAPTVPGPTRGSAPT